jgi:hypothetical protein
MAYVVCDVFFSRGAFEGALGRVAQLANCELFVAVQLTPDVPTVLVPLDGVLSLENRVRLRCGNAVDVDLARGKSLVVPLSTQLDCSTLTLLSVHESSAVFLASGSISLAGAARSLIESADGVGLVDSTVAISSMTGTVLARLSCIVKLTRVPAGLEPFFAQQVAGLSAALGDLAGATLPRDTLSELAASVRRTAADNAGRGAAQVEAETEASIARGAADLATPNVFMPPPLWYGALGGAITVALPSAAAPAPAPRAPSPPALPQLSIVAPSPDLALVDGFLADLLRWKAFTSAVGSAGVRVSPAGASPPPTPSRSSPQRKGVRRPQRGTEGLESTSLGDGLARSSNALGEALVGSGVMERGAATAVVNMLRRGAIGRGTGSGRLMSLAHLADGGRSTDFAPAPLAAPHSALAALLARTLPRTLSLLCDREAPADFRVALEAIARGAVASEAAVGGAADTRPGTSGLPSGRTSVPASSVGRSLSPKGVPEGRPVPPPPPPQRGGRVILEKPADGRGAGKRPEPAGPASVPSVASFSLNRTPPRSPGFNNTIFSARGGDTSVDSAVTPSLSTGFVPPPVGAGVRLPAHLRARIAAQEEERRAARTAANKRAKEEAESGPGEMAQRSSFVRTVHEPSGLTRGEARPRIQAVVPPVPARVAPSSAQEMDIASVGARVHAEEVGGGSGRRAPYASRPAPAPSLPPALDRLLERARQDTQRDRRGPTTPVRAASAVTSAASRSLDISGLSRTSKGSSGSSIASSAAAQARRSAGGALLLMPSARANASAGSASSKAKTTPSTAAAPAGKPGVPLVAVLSTPPRPSTRSRPASSTPARSVTFAEDVEEEAAVQDETGEGLSLSTASTHSRTGGGALMSPGTPAIFRARGEEEENKSGGENVSGPPGGGTPGQADLTFLTRSSKSGESGPSDILSVISG